MSAKLYFMDQDTFDLSDTPLAIEVCEFDIDKIDIIHSASNPNFTMGGGRDAFLKKEYDFQPKEELQLEGKLLSLISVDEKIQASEQGVYEAYKKYFKYCMENEKKKIGIVALGCGVSGLTKEQSITQLFRALLDVFCIGYKAMKKDYYCRDVKFEVGKEYTQSGKIKVCKNGFHFCPVMNDCFGYYDFSDDTKVCSVIGSGEFDFERDKVCFQHIKIVSEHTWYEVLEMINIGKNNTGRGNTGDQNTGDQNTGDRNTGDRNTGHRNTGDRNTGHRNTGDQNTGHRNTGHRNTGFFMTMNGKNYSFNKETDVDMFNYDFPYYFRFDITEWVYESSMTAKEMKEYPTYKTTGGYLKKFEYKEARINSFEEADKNDLRKTLDIPNFDYKIFEEITGITKEMITNKLK